MRPCKLTMSAFLAYGDVQVIDFTKLGKSGLYLISGDTGSGKTTIFDAIMFALYGSASGDLREVKTLRSKYASPIKETFVELVFECGKKEYTVRRKPEYEKPKKNGSGMTKSIAEAFLRYPDGRIQTNIRDVTASVEKIIGLNRDQFNQVAMIAQGQFRELLVADTKTRQSIFRHIFDTGNYERLQKRISEDYRKALRDCEDLIQLMRQYAGAIKAEEEHPFFSQVQKAREGKLLTQDCLELLTQILKNDSAELADVCEKIKTCNELKEQALADLEKAKAYQANLEKLKLIEEKSLKNDESVSKAAAAVKEAEMAKPQIASLADEAARLEAKLSDYDKYESAASQLQCAVNKIGLLSNDIEKKTAQQRQIASMIDADKKRLEACGNPQADQIGNSQQLDVVEDQIKQCEEIAQRALLLKRLEQKVIKTKECFIKRQNEEKRAGIEAAHARQVWLMGQAGIMARDLVEGESCPVCGSIHHPKPAKLPEQFTDRQKVEQLESAYEKSRALCVEASVAAGKAKTEYEAGLKEFVCLGKRIAEGNQPEEIEANIEKLKNALAVRKNELQDEKTAIMKRLILKNEISDRIPKYEEKNERLRSELEKSKNELTKQTADSENLRLSVNELKKDLQFDFKREAQEHIRHLLDKKGALESAVDESNRLYQHALLEKKELEGAAQTVKELLAKAEKTDLINAKERLNSLNEHLKTLDERKTSLSHHLAANKEIYAGLEKGSKDLTKYEKKAQWLKSLDDTANGRSADAGGKLMLETYVQQAYFDRIVHKANQRFEKMTKNQYTLVRAAAPDDNRGQSGLDLEVIDHYNSSRRTVKSLSGGEQFEASLSLALGLSDMVQESSAGIKLDCMFIDEGFGSLDDDALRHSIKALNDLSGNDRLVGIISHVSELERMIDRKILVKKDLRGFSHAEISGKILTDNSQL